jgi:hypothetical protein
VHIFKYLGSVITSQKEILYGCEILTLAGKMASTLMTWERNVLRKMYGPKYEQGV